MTWYIGDKLYYRKSLHVFKHDLTLNRYYIITGINDRGYKCQITDKINKYNKTYYEFIKKEYTSLYKWEWIKTTKPWIFFIEYFYKLIRNKFKGTKELNEI